MPRPKRKPTTPSSELRRKIEEIRRDLADAQNDSAYAPCASLHRLEIDTLALLWEREAIEAAEAKAAAEAIHDQRDNGAVFAAVLEAARELPAEMRDQLAAALAHEPVLRVVGG
jgi:hypothetical protein